MILDLTDENLKSLNITREDLDFDNKDFGGATNYINSNETIYVCNIEKKIYTKEDCGRKMYFNIEWKGEKINSFPATCPQLFKEYFDLELNKFLELQKSLLLDGFNENSQRKRFKDNQINLYTDKLERNKTKLKNRPDAMREVCEPIELYIMFCEDYEQGQPEKKKLELKDFFMKGVDEEPINKIKETFKGLRIGKEMAYLIYILHKELNVIDYLINDKRKARKHFIIALKEDDNIRTAGVDNYFNTNDVTLKDANSKNYDEFKRIKKQLTDVILPKR